MKTLNRRSLLRAIGGTQLPLPLFGLFQNVAGLGCAAPAPYSETTSQVRPRLGTTGGTARRLIVYYFPDGIPEPPDGEPSQWHMSGSGKNFTLSTNLQPLTPFRNACVFFNNLTLGALGEGAHPPGAMKLLTGTPDPSQNQQIQGPSIDQYLGKTIGQTTPFSSIYLGAQATVDSLTSDAFISYPNATQSTVPLDNPFTAFSSLFGGSAASVSTGPNPDDVSIFNAVMGDLNDLQTKLGGVEKQKLQAHFDALNQLEKQITGMGAMSGMTCKSPTAAASALTNDPSWLVAPENFPAILKAQMDLMVQAMACGLTRVGVIQASQHTTNLIMSRFAGTPMYAPPGSLDMRSHQASHYGNQGTGTLFTDYVMQVTWWVEQFAYLLNSLQSLPEGAGTMLDNSLVLMCTEIANGSTHSHHNMPFVLAGGGGGVVAPGTLGTIYDIGVRNHADLLTSIAIAMGDPATSSGQQGFGQGSTAGGLPGLLE